MPIEVGQQLQHYRLVKKLGAGGMGVVYEATDTRLNRNVAVKVLPTEVTQSPERRARFQQEAQLAAALTNIKPMLEFLGAPEADKRLAVIDGGHVPESQNEFIREALGWFDLYLGPVER